MNFLFRVIYAAHANGTHHKLALDALRELSCEDAPAWRAVFLRDVELYLQGSKAPDKEFKDFKNHVLHVREGFWGGAPEKVENWYAKAVRALKEGNFSEAVWCAGVLSHYYTDPIHPFHTAQSEAESNIHRAVEWSISKSYETLRTRGKELARPDIILGSGETWLRDLVIAGAEYANEDYERLIAHYNFDLGVVDPPAGLDATAQDLVGRLLVYASSGLAGILDRAIIEAEVAPPRVDLALPTVLATLKIPVKWVTRKMSDAAEARAVERMYDELQETGRVEQTLSDDDRTIRRLHANEVGEPDQARRQREREARRSERRVPHGAVALPSVASMDAASDMPRKPSLRRQGPTAVTPPSDGSAGRANRTDLVTGTAVPVTVLRAGDRNTPSRRAEQRTTATATPSSQRCYLNETDEIEAAPSIGPKTAARLNGAGVFTVTDLLKSNPDELADRVNARHIRPAVIVDWQDQARLVMEVPGLRGTHAQLFVGAGLRTIEDIALADPSDVMAAMLKFAATREGQRLLGSGSAPDLERVTNWIRSAERALAA